MTLFDPGAWRARAWGRFERGVRRGAPGGEAAWARDVVAISDLGALVAWAGDRGLTVKFAKKTGGTYDGGGREILISSRLSPPRQVAYLLHECGHHLIEACEHGDRFRMGYPATDPRVRRTFHHRMTILEEETEAWHRGWRLAERLGLGITRAAYDEVRLDCLASYVRWVVRPGDMVKGEE